MSVCLCVLLVKLSFRLVKRKKSQNLTIVDDVACSYTAWNFDPTAIRLKFLTNSLMERFDHVGFLFVLRPFLHYLFVRKRSSSPPQLV